MPMSAPLRATTIYMLIMPMRRCAAITAISR